MSRELLQQALDALLISAPLGHAMENYEYRHRLIKDIEAELAKPEQEKQIEPEDWRHHRHFHEQAEKPEPRKEWVGLTEHEIWECQKPGLSDDVYKLIEAKLRERNT